LAGITPATETEFDKKYKLFTSDDSPLSPEQQAIGLETLLGIGVTKDSFQNKVEMYNEMKAKGTLTPDMLALFGIPKVQQAEFEKKMNELDLLAQQSGMKPAELMDRKIALVSNFTPDDGKTAEMRNMDYKAEQAGLVPGTQEYKDFFLNYGHGNTDIDIDFGEGDNTDAYMKEGQKLMVENDFKQIDEVDKARKAITKLDGVLKLIDKGDANIGALSSFYQGVDEVMAKFNLSAESAASATDTQLLEAALGSDVFGMIAVLGIGARGIDTPAERDFLIQVMTGRKEMTPEALRMMTTIRRKYYATVIQDYNNRVNDGYYAYYNKHIRKTPIYEIPEIPQVVVPQVANTVSIDRATELSNKYNLGGQ